MIKYNTDDVLSELRAVAMARPADCLKWEDGKLELREEIPADCAAAIASIERSPSGVKLRFHDKLKALEMLLQHSEAGETGNRSSLLEAILNATRGPLGVGGAEEKEEEKEHENGIFISQGG